MEVSLFCEVWSELSYIKVKPDIRISRQESHLQTAKNQKPQIFNLIFFFLKELREEDDENDVEDSMERAHEFYDESCDIVIPL